MYTISTNHEFDQDPISRKEELASNFFSEFGRLEVFGSDAPAWNRFVAG